MNFPFLLFLFIISLSSVAQAWTPSRLVVIPFHLHFVELESLGPAPYFCTSLLFRSNVSHLNPVQSSFCYNSLTSWLRALNQPLQPLLLNLIFLKHDFPQDPAVTLNRCWSVTVDVLTYSWLSSPFGNLSPPFFCSLNFCCLCECLCWG